MEAQDICQPFTTPKPFVDPAVFKYTGNSVVHYYDSYYKDKVRHSFQGPVKIYRGNGNIDTGAKIFSSKNGSICGLPSYYEYRIPYR